jgi:hypothetical protein
MLLAITQGALTFSGSAGYLASAQTWLAIIFVALAMKLHSSKKVGGA